LFGSRSYADWTFAHHERVPEAERFAIPARARNAGAGIGNTPQSCDNLVVAPARWFTLRSQIRNDSEIPG